MKKYFLGIAIATLTLIVACVKDLEEEGVYTETELIGTVVEKSGNVPIPNIKVKVTDGDHIYTTTTTGTDGSFSLTVNFDEVNKNYYLLLDGSPNLPIKQEQLRGLGNKVYDYKLLVLYDQTDVNLLPQVTTNEISNVGVSTATVAGKVNSNGGHNIIERGICYATHQTPTTDDQKKTAGADMGDYSCDLIDLQANTTYYVRAYATNSIGTSYGVQKTFTTLDGTPILSNVQSSNIIGNSAKVQCNITSDGGVPVTSRGFCWSTSSNPSIQGEHSTDGNGTGVFTHTLTSLQPSTTYFVRAYAVNSQGTFYSSEATVVTTDGRPVVATYSASSITATSAIIGGGITSDGGYAVTEKGVCYSTSQQPTISGQHINLGTGTSSFSTAINELTPSTVYYVRAYAVNEKGIAYGSQSSFPTNNGLPTVTTTAVTMNGTTAVSGGNVTSDGGFPVTARGICYGIYPNPDLSSSYSHTTNGTGTGYFSSTIENATGTIYIRAYATNANGTVYGNQIILNSDYLALPTFQFNGHTYRVAPAANNLLNWENANAYCNNLTYCGYSDWRLPTIYELQQMSNDRLTIGGFGTSSYWWSGTRITHSDGSYSYYYIDIYYGDVNYHYGNSFGVRPIRQDD